VRRAIIFTVAIVFGVALLSRTMTFTVRFTEAAVLTTFGKAAENVIKEPGLKFKWPVPVQSVTKYDTRVRIVEVKVEQQQTRDDRQIVVEPYCTWRVADPLKFFQRFSSAGDRAADHYAEAERQLKSGLRSAMSETSNYALTDLFTTDAASRIPELEGRMLATMKGSGLDQSGIEVVDAGISRITLPESTTEAVFNSMKADRARLVKELEATGDAEARRITSTAEQNAKKIEVFAGTYAAEIRRKGDLEAAQYLALMNENPELAVFLKEIEFIREALGKQITLFLSTSMPGLQLLRLDAVERAGDGRIPGGDGLFHGVAGDAIEPRGDKP
jgi:membrane protease subunit HflC